MLHHRIRAVFVLLAVACASQQAWAVKLGPEFRVNTTTANNQWSPSVAGLSGGGFVVVWQSDEQDGSGYGTYGQRYNATGVPLGGEFRVNTTTGDDQWFPSVAGLADGGFVVTWTSDGQDGSGFGVYAQRYNAAGAKIGGEFRVNMTTAGSQQHSSVAGLTGGAFVITWTSDVGSFGDTDIHARLFRPGAKPGVAFRVNTTTANGQASSSVAALSSGFVVTWNSFGQDGSLFGVYGQRFSATGSKVGGEFRINSHTAGNQFRPSVARLTGDRFVVTWQSDGPDGFGPGIYGKRSTADGQQFGSEFYASLGRHVEPSVAGLSNGGFVVTWTSIDATATGPDVLGRIYDAAGAPIAGSGFRANTTIADDQSQSSVAGLSGGGFVVIWYSNGQDGSDRGIYGQRFSP